MNNVIKFIVFLIYTTSIFFLPNSKIILIPIAINLAFMLFMHSKMKEIIRGTIKILPFIVFTFLINCWLDTYLNAIWIGIKLLIVCNITIIYSKLTTITGIADTIYILVKPLRKFGINAEGVKVMVSISISMLPILRKNLEETKEACKAKNIKLNLRNTKFILTSFFITLLKRVNQIEDSLVAKGYRG